MALEEVTQFSEKIAGIVRRIDLNILRTQKKLSDSITAIVDGEAQVWHFLTLTSIGLIYMSAGLLSFSLQQWMSAAGSFIGKIRTITASIIDSLPVKLFLATHNMLSAVWIDYRNVFLSVNNAAAGLSATLGYSLEFLPTALNNIKNVYVQSATLLGFNTRASDISFLDFYAQFLEKWDNNFDRYARNPGMIMDDIQDWAELYAYQLIPGMDNGINTAIQNTMDIIDEKIDQIDELEESVNTLITELPEENFSRVQEWYAPIHAEITDFQDTYVTPALEYLNNLTDILDEHADKTDETLKEYLSLLANWPDVMSGIYFDASDIGEWNRSLFDYLVNNAGALSDSEIEDSLRDRLEATIQKPVIEAKVIVPADPGAGASNPITPPLKLPPIQGTIYAEILPGLTGSGSNTMLNDITGDI